MSGIHIIMIMSGLFSNVFLLRPSTLTLTVTRLSCTSGGLSHALYTVVTFKGNLLDTTWVLRLFRFNLLTSCLDYKGLSINWFLRVSMIPLPCYEITLYQVSYYVNLSCGRASACVILLSTSPSRMTSAEEKLLYDST